jgi:hypothetical protein
LSPAAQVLAESVEPAYLKATFGAYFAYAPFVGGVLERLLENNLDAIPGRCSHLNSS